jgi:hypothetical protein
MQALYSWSVFSASNSKALWDARLNSTNITSGKDLLLPGPLPGRHGDLVVLQLVTTFSGSTTKATTNVHITLTASPLQSIITGKSGGVKPNATIVLDGSRSLDPDDPQGREPMELSWSCYHEDFPKACFGAATAANMPMVAGNTYVIPATSMDQEKWHKIQLRVSKGM